MIRGYHPVVLVVVCVAILASVQFAIGRVWVFPTAPATAEENRNSRLVDDRPVEKAAATTGQLVPESPKAPASRGGGNHSNKQQ
jgi:hypothetical protein